VTAQLRHELAKAWAARSSYAVVAAVFAVFVASVVFMEWQGGLSGEPAAHLGRRIFSSMVMLETLTTAMVAPFIALNQVATDRIILRSPFPSTSIVSTQLAVAGVATVGLLFLSSAASLWVVLDLGGVSTGEWLVTRFLLSVFVLAFVLLGLFCSRMLRDIHMAAALLLLVLGLLLAGPLLLGPLLSHVPDAGIIIQPTLVTNPFVGMASALDWDVFRTELLYRWSPIAQRRFTYPSWGLVGLVYGGGAGLLYLTTVRRVSISRFDLAS